MWYEEQQWQNQLTGPFCGLHLNDQHTCQLLLLCTKTKINKQSLVFVAGSFGLFLFLRSIAESRGVVVAVHMTCSFHVLLPFMHLNCFLFFHSPSFILFFIILEVGGVLYLKKKHQTNEEVYSCKCNDLNPLSEHCKWCVCPAVLCENL